MLRTHPSSSWTILAVALTATLPATAEETPQPKLRSTQVALRPFYAEGSVSKPGAATDLKSSATGEQGESEHHPPLNPARYRPPQEVPPKSPARFNPDPGQWNQPPVPEKPKPPMPFRTSPALTSEIAPPEIALTPPTASLAESLAPDFGLLFPAQPIPQRRAPNFAAVPVLAGDRHLAGLRWATGAAGAGPAAPRNPKPGDL